MTTRTAIQSLRLVSVIEGLSWLLLIGTMIYRANTGHHEPVKVAGAIHGGFFCLFSFFLYQSWIKANWKISFCLGIGLLSFIPGGFFVAERFLKKKLAEES